ncbi:hypothetical protein NGRA_0155 [Nosema granulosis]|uniref:Kinetochore protein Spc24 n=1 Tax=Nosema granulosis TaxID=83296 RepID=A0A9P6H2J5_9MICR|nr:hypothetical protein NGRA_0155 [Nosema granulosis]
MNNSKNILEEILKLDSSFLDSSLLQNILSKKSRSTPTTASTPLEILKKKNLNLSNEIEKLRILENKKNEIYNKINNERLKLAKKYICDEDSIMNLRNILETQEREIEDLNKALVNVNKPSYNQLYLGILRGLGVDFSKNICRIRNRRLKNIVEVEIDKKDEPVYLTTNRIWENM